MKSDTTSDVFHEFSTFHLRKMSNNLETVHEGWLTKSPPATRVFGGRWRRRWFVLKHTGEIPGQYFLCYYTDESCRKLKGRIDLDQCEQVDTGLQFENNKQKYQHMFDVRTPKRIYYLAAESEDDMNRWVKCVCQVCGFKAYTADDSLYNYSPTGDEGPSTPSTVTETLEPSESESPPVSPTSTTSAYIPISECITGPPVSLTGPTASWRPAGATGPGGSVLHQLQPLPIKRSNHIPPGITADEFYDCPRQLKPRPPAALDLRQGAVSAGEWDAQKSPGTDAESVFTDDEWAGGGGGGTAANLRPAVNWDTFPSSEGDTPLPRPSDSSTDLDISGDAPRAVANSLANSLGNSLANRYGRIAMSDGRSRISPPPRPPKPSHLLLDPSASHNYLNIDNVSPAAVPNATTTPNATTATADERRHKTDSVSASGSEPPSPLVATSTPLDGPSAVPLISDEMYDFPRSHQYPDPEGGDPTRPPPSARHCYSNAAPGQVNGDVFIYDFQQQDSLNHHDTTEEPTSPRSEGSSVTSNLPSPSVDMTSLDPAVSAPPAVDRGLKPRRKMSDSAASSEPSPGLSAPASASLSASIIGPPNVDRKLKPRKHPDDIMNFSGSLTLAAVPQGRRRVHDGTRSLRKTRPGPTAISLNRSRSSRSEHCSSSDDDLRHSPDDDLYHFQQDGHSFMSSGKEIKYLDLDLDKDSSHCGGPLTSGLGSGAFLSAPKSPEKAPVNPTGTVYKTVDFVKTEAFNRTRLRVEEERSRGDNAPTSLSAK